MLHILAHLQLTGQVPLVQIYTAKENLVILQSQIPEAIITTYEKYDVNELHRLIDWADVVAIGSGLGTKKTARKMKTSMLSQLLL